MTIEFTHSSYGQSVFVKATDLDELERKARATLDSIFQSKADLTERVRSQSYKLLEAQKTVEEQKAHIKELNNALRNRGDQAETGEAKTEGAVAAAPVNSYNRQLALEYASRQGGPNVVQRAREIEKYLSEG